MKIGIYERGLTISGTLRGFGNKTPKKRKEVTKFSKSSKKNLAWNFMQGPWKSMITLDYGDEYKKKWGADKKRSKKELQGFLQNLRNRGIKYLWVLEWQKRHMPHYHVWMDTVFDDCSLWDDNGMNSWRPLMINWLNITGQEKDKKARDHVLFQWQYTNWTMDVRANYVMKYAAKSEQKMLPENIKKFGRWSGWSQGLELIKEIIDIGGNDEKYKNKEDRKACYSAKRQIRKIIEKHTKYRFTKDKKKSSLPMKLYLSEKLISSCIRVIEYYIFGLDSKYVEVIPF